MLKRKAFTLIELLTTIAIIGVISAVAVVATNSSRDKAKLAASQDFEARVQHAAGSDIIGEWLFNEGSDTAVRDTSGNGRNGTAVNMTWGTGHNGSGGSGTFAASSYVLLGNDPIFTPSAFTITAWIKPGNFSGSYNYIYSNARDCCGTYNGINFFLYANTLAGTIWNGGAATVSSNAKISNDPVWTFVAFSYNGSKLALYINGRLDNTLSSALGVGTPESFSTYIGTLSNGAGSLGLTGSIDQVRFYSSAVVASEIEKIYLAQKEKFFAAK